MQKAGVASKNVQHKKAQELREKQQQLQREVEEMEKTLKELKVTAEAAADPEGGDQDCIMTKIVFSEVRLGTLCSPFHSHHA